MLRFRKITLALFLPLALLGGCASTPEAPPIRDAEAKRFENDPRAAIIYLYREDARTGGVSTLWIDGRLIGETLPATYFRIVARPGRNRITGSGGDQGRIEITTSLGEVYFVAAQVRGETQSESSTLFRSVTPDAGKAAIARCCSMLETWRPGQKRFNF